MPKTTFEEIIAAPWTKDEDGYGLILVETEMGIGGAVGEFMLVLDEYFPISHALSDNDTTKMYNLLLHAGEQSANVATEKVVWMLEEMRIATGIDREKLNECAAQAKQIARQANAAATPA